jgi:hypothetical protein
LTCVNAAPATPAEPERMNARRVVQLGFWFFLVKGLLWLAIPAAALIAGQHFDGF